jgi:hypothetical protein
MIVGDLIKILGKCDPSVDVSFCHGGDSENTDGIGFVESDITSGNVYLYEDEPSYGNDGSIDHAFEIDTVTEIMPGLVETTYRAA